MIAEPEQQPTLAGEIRRRIEAVYELPPMPEMARRVLELRGDPDASIADLAGIVELDPSLAAQVVRYATSPLYGYRGKINSIHDAITRVLGFDLVMNMALGLATGKSFSISADGPLGLHAFWRHAVYSAALMQALVRRMPPELRPDPGMAYLAGLLHNFGFLLLGHLFPPEFTLLNKLVAARPASPVTALEKCVLGMGQAQDLLDMGHAQMGAWLMQSWQMPEEIIVTLREHHNPDYADEHAEYVQLVILADHLLKRHEIGDAPHGELPAGSLERTGLDEALAEAVLEDLFEDVSLLDGMARQLATN
ncbi:HDOD domain-containing protein [Thiohalobacter sp. IOR34]|uniref:HDOD domain-containing protein n=1 Tax=Thiohalobacter sp. IOR34 TaxID=3057176 RepID=UPI0025B2085D|nr:HDOD domain-containing protein [Thiohalobacter sp. IOR34]WJW74766.1 HDOD domain-containing protein [Thiohalobacter sp. IOR34]